MLLQVRLQISKLFSNIRYYNEAIDLICIDLICTDLGPFM